MLYEYLDAAIRVNLALTKATAARVLHMSLIGFELERKVSVWNQSYETVGDAMRVALSTEKFGAALAARLTFAALSRNCKLCNRKDIQVVLSSPKAKQTLQEANREYAKEFLFELVKGREREIYELIAYCNPQLEPNQRMERYTKVLKKTARDFLDYLECSRFGVVSSGLQLWANVTRRA